MKPLSSCALFGAVRALAGVRDALVLQHSVVGCQWGSLAFRYAGKPYNVRQASSVIYEDEVIGGGEKLLAQALAEAERCFPQCGAVFVVSGCIPNMIGDDVEGVLHDCASRQTLLHVKAPGYAGNIDSGVEAAYLALLSLMQTGLKKQAQSVNILGLMSDDFYVDNDIAALKAAFDQKLDMNCVLADCTLAEIEKMPQAALNICFGYGEPLAKKMQERFGVPYIKCAYPYGVAGLQKLLRQLEAALELSFTDEIEQLEREAAKLAYRCADYLTNLYQMPAAVVADKAHLAGMKDFLTEELGLHLVLAQDTAEYSLDKLEADIEQAQPVLLCGSSFLKHLSDEKELPLLRFVYPTFDHLCLSNNTLIGAAGAAYLIEQLVNAALQQNYKPAGLYAGLRETICEGRYE